MDDEDEDVMAPDEDNDDVMAPMVDALTGALSAVVLVSIFMMISVTATVPKALQEFGLESLVKAQEEMNDIFKREPPFLDLNNNRIYFFKIFKLEPEQILMLKDAFSKKAPKKMTVYSNESENVISFNVLFFLNSLNLSDYLNALQIIYLPARDGDITEFVWE